MSEELLSDFISRQRELLLVERNAEVGKTSLILTSCSPKLLEQQGLGLNGLMVSSITIGLGGKSLVEFERPLAYHASQLLPPHTFRPGDLARVEENTATSDKKPSKTGSKATISASPSKCEEGIVYRVTDTRIVIAFEPSESSDEQMELPESLKLANSVTFDRMDRALDQLETIALPSRTSQGKGIPQMNKLIQVLLGLASPAQSVPTDPMTYLDVNLNDSQKEAISFALGAQEVALIHGPPGTGKTHTLVEIIRQLILLGKKVLVCSASNLAVDNLLERLIPHNIPLTRLGHPARVLADLHNSTLDAQATRSEQSALAKDVKKELEDSLAQLSGKGKSIKGRLKGVERRKMYRKREGGVVKSVINQAQIVLATCHSAGGRQLLNEAFDVVVIDEATQALEAVCWIPILKSKKLILAGDPLQLPPTIMSNFKITRKALSGIKPDVLLESICEPLPATDPTSESGSDSDEGREVEAMVSGDTTIQHKPSSHRVLKPSQSLAVTLFDRLEKMYGSTIKRMLTVQYRMNDNICKFPSAALYGSKLLSSPAVASHLLQDLPNATCTQDIADVLAVPIVFFDTAGCEYFERDDGGEVGDLRTGKERLREGSKCNVNEASVVKRWVDKLVETGVLPSQIAVITPYQAQVRLLTSLLRPSMPEIEVGTVDSMQGREKEAVLLSLVRSNDKREVGFLKEKRRLNVAMTRARRHLCIVGDSSTIRHGGRYLKAWLDWLESNADVRYGGE